MEKVEFMCNLITDRGYKKIMEVGFWKGKHARYTLDKIGDKLDEYWSIDSFHMLGAEHGRMANMNCLDWHNLHINACELMIRYPKLKVLKLRSEDASKIFPRQYFDLVFLDGPHYYRAVRADIEVWEPSVRLGGILCGHGYSSRKHQVHPAVERKYGVDFQTHKEADLWYREIGHGDS
jgi:hypothetical protein